MSHADRDQHERSCPCRYCALSMWHIYRSPRDFPPGMWAVREILVLRTGEILRKPCAVFSTLEGARSRVPWGLYNLPLGLDEDPVIYETWI